VRVRAARAIWCSCSALSLRRRSLLLVRACSSFAGVAVAARTSRRGCSSCCRRSPSRLQELAERLLRAEAFPFQAALEPRFLLGLLLQLPFGLLALLVARALLRVVERLVCELARARTPRLQATVSWSLLRAVRPAADSGPRARLPRAGPAGALGSSAPAGRAHAPARAAGRTRPRSRGRRSRGRCANSCSGSRARTRVVKRVAVAVWRKHDRARLRKSAAGRSHTLEALTAA
jgi:hypothetical protein